MHIQATTANSSSRKAETAGSTVRRWTLRRNTPVASKHESAKNGRPNACTPTEALGSVENPSSTHPSASSPTYPSRTPLLTTGLTRASAPRSELGSNPQN